MITIDIENSFSTITGLSIQQHNELKKELSYDMNGSSKYMQSQFGHRTVSLLTKKGKFPTGLLYYAVLLLKKSSVKYNTIDHRIKPEPFKGLYKLSLPVIPYPEQDRAVEVALHHHRGIISAPTGSGKSVIMAILVNKLQLKTLIVVPTLELKNQLRTSFKSWFGETSNIVIENIGATCLETMSNFDCLIIDEAHHVAAKTYRDLNKGAWKGIYYRFYFTATPFRSRDEERLLFESVAGRVIYSLSYRQAVEKGFIVPVEGYFYEIERTKVSGNLNSWFSVYNELVVKNHNRNALIASLLSHLKGNSVSTLCLVKEIEHGQILSEMSKVHFANGKDKDSTDLIKFFSEGKLKALIGTNGIVGEGVDTRAAEYIIIAGLGKSKNQFMQQIGRGVRVYPGKDSCKIITFLDKSHKWTRDHFSTQVKILREEYGCEIIKLDDT
jgi:superfamily II DNA or RNA helicase